MKKKTYSTPEAARLMGVSTITLHRWIRSGKIRASQGIPQSDGSTFHRWTRADIARGRKVKAAQKPGRPKAGAK